MGLTAASAIAASACGSSNSGPFYGLAQTGGSTTTSTSTSTTSTSTETLTGIDGSGGNDGG